MLRARDNFLDARVAIIPIRARDSRTVAEAYYYARVLESRSRFQNFTFLPVCPIPREIRRIAFTLCCSSIKCVSPIARNQQLHVLVVFFLCFSSFEFHVPSCVWKVCQKRLENSLDFATSRGQRGGIARC